MLLFWLLSSLMVLAALALVVPSLLRGRAARHAAPGDANVALYRERIEELERERDRGEVDPDRYAALREDLERGLLSDADGREAGRAAAGSPSPGMAVAVAVAVPAASLALYLWLGSPHGVDSRTSPRDAAATTDGVPSVEAMVASLADRLATDPDDAEGWLLLARSQVILERHDAALAGFRRAHALLGDEPALLADWAEAEAAADGNRFTAAALGRLERALEIDPDHEKALWLGGFAAAQDGRTDIAVARWERLLAIQPPDSREATIVSELLARIRGMGSETTTATADGETDSAAPATAASETGTAGGARIVVEVSLSPDLAAGTGDGEPVFVFARAPGAAGPPVAVARTVTGALPAVVVLDESSAMVPSRSLAGVERVMVTARVARSGTVTRTAGDLEGTFGPVEVADSGSVRIVISQVVP